MRPPTNPELAPDNSSRVRLQLLVSHEHLLYRLAEAIDWARFEAELGSLYAEDVGRPGLPTRLMVGLHYLKYLFDESDESVVEKYVENPYWQFFCGRTYFEHELPCHPTSLVRWRWRLGAAGVEKLLTETLSTAKREQALRESEIRRVNVDTTVQEKAIAFPTDARLYHKARCALVRAARAAFINLRQSYARLGQQCAGAARALRPGPTDEAGTARNQAFTPVSGARHPRHPAQVSAARTRAQGAAGAERAHPPSAAARLAEALQRACARGRVHRQGQGAPAVRVRLQGGSSHHVKEQLGGRRRGRA